MSSTLRKCLVWDLDNTLWDGILLEGGVRLRPVVPDILATLDRRGVLNSIASRGEENAAREQLARLDLDRYFLAPRINWLPKATNITDIAEELGIGCDALAFVDDDAYEREAMAFMRPEVLVLDAARIAGICDLPEFRPGTVTAESARRREFYREESARRAAAADHADRRSFLEGCRMRLSVRAPHETDTPRILELMSRTHQLNTTGLRLDEAEIRALVTPETKASRPARRLVVADLIDRFGDYGTVGVAVSEAESGRWQLVYLALSCRVLGRGVESAFLHALIRGARQAGHDRIETLFRETGRNGSMRALYQMAGLRADQRPPAGGALTFTATPESIRRPPGWVEVQCESF